MNKQLEDYLDSNIPLGLVEDRTKQGIVNYFNGLPFTMQWGVYLEFFDSVGIRICIENFVLEGDPDDYPLSACVYKIGEDEDGFMTCERLVRWMPYYSRQQAQEESLIKAFEILEQG